MSYFCSVQMKFTETRKIAFLLSIREYLNKMAGFLYRFIALVCRTGELTHNHAKYEIVDK